MGEEIFRKKSIDKIKSPENLNDYIKVSNPGVWLILVAVGAILAGIFIWGVFGNITASLDVRAEAKGGELICTLTEEEFASVGMGDEIKVGDVNGTVTDILGQFSGTDDYLIVAKADVPDGTYDVKIVTEKIRPISFILN